jgi:hypothetical protein
MSACENILECETNKGKYKLSIIAQFNDYNPVVYTIRIEKPDGEKADFISSLEGFKRFGQLLLDLHSFAQEKLYAKDTQQLKELLTAENISTYVRFKKAATFKK